MNNEPDPLDTLLTAWKAPCKGERPIKPEVWRRIALLEAEQESPSFWERVEKVFQRPSFALAFVAACMLAGLFLAELRVAQTHAQRSLQFASSYLQLIDPLVSKDSLVKTHSGGTQP